MKKFKNKASWVPLTSVIFPIWENLLLIVQNSKSEILLMSYLPKGSRDSILLLIIWCTASIKGTLLHFDQAT